MGKEAAAIRQEIEETRHQMESTVDAISYKTDIKSRLQENVAEKRSAMSDTMQQVKRTIIGKAHEAEDHMPDSDEVRDKAQQMKGKTKRQAKRGVRMAEENPLGLALGGIAAGVLAGLLVPSTKLEDEQLGALSDKVKDTIAETGHEAFERGKDVAEDAAHAAVDAAKETMSEEGQEQGQELASSAKSNVQQM